MNIRQLIASVTALTSAVVLSSCTVDGYGYSSTYGPDYGPSYYSPAYYGTTVYTSGYHSRPYYSQSCYTRPRPGHGSYCPPVIRGGGGHGSHGSYSGGGSHGGGSHGGGSHGGGSHGGGRPHVDVRPSGGGFAGYREAARESRPEPVSRPSPAIEHRSSPVIESRPVADHSSSRGSWSGAATMGDRVREARGR